MKRKRKVGQEALLRNAKNVLHREGLTAGKRYAEKHNITLTSSMLRTAALWWERSRHRAAVRKSLGKYGWKLYKLRLGNEELDPTQGESNG
jgi:hypothetical protein